jgi:hypothetical protein
MLLAWYQGKTGDYVHKTECGIGDKPAWIVYAESRGGDITIDINDEEWNIEYFVQGLEFENKCLRFSADYVSGRLMKTDIVFESGGRVTLTTRNRGKGAERWPTHLKGKKHIQPIE